MGQKDITEKVLEDYNDVFADIINGLLFDGVQEIKPEALENTTVHAQYKAEDGKVHELERDIAKYWKEEKVELAICGIENQSTVEKHMPFRIIGYDGSAYRNQLQQERRKMLPVVTIVLYFGTDRHWNSRKKIKELMEIPRHLNLNRIWSLPDCHLNRKLPERFYLRNLHRCVFLSQTVSVLKYLIPADRN